jgi:TPR repeat protein
MTEYHEKVQQRMHRLAAQGRGYACAYLGDYYATVGNAEQAAEWYRRGTEKDNTGHCAYNLGVRYRDGDPAAFIPVDDTKALQLFHLAFAMKDSDAAYELGRREYVHRRFRKAIKYFQVGIKQGHKMCLQLLGHSVLELISRRNIDIQPITLDEAQTIYNTIRPKEVYIEDHQSRDLEAEGRAAKAAQELLDACGASSVTKKTSVQRHRKTRRGPTKSSQEEIRCSSSDDYNICPITLDSFIDPVQTVDGHIYERAAIQMWFERKGAISPLTNLELASTDLISVER